jgi:hypothetical protein
VSAWARPGVKCVCVDDAPRDSRQPMVVKGRQYEIESVHDRSCTLFGVDDGQFYWLDRFRPLVTQQDDVALFQHLLTGTPVRELVE